LATSFELGDYHCTCFRVGQFEIDAGTVFGNVAADELAAALARHGLGTESLVFNIHTLLVDTGANRVLIDPGGSWDDPNRLSQTLAEAGIDSASIDTVVISHGHADHFWGGISTGRRPRFESARYWMQKREWDHWLASDNPEPNHAATFRETLLPIEDRFTLIDGEDEIVPGIRGVPTPGHSPGHMVVRIGEHATYVGDVLLSPVNVEHPEWTARFDVWPEQVVNSRRALLKRLAGDGSLVLTCHFTPPAGKIVAARDGWRWLPETTTGPAEH
jgi:glyoxylase-like metal-dependent hydrolase (beta-lactamase superfamily II)